MAICPLAVDWGNAADWAAVVVGLGAAAATVFVAIAANRTSMKAAEIAEQSKGIAQQQHAETVALREGNARVIGRLLLTEIGSLPARLDMIRRMVDQSTTIEGGPSVTNVKMFKAALGEAQADLTPTSVSVLDRIHNLPDVLGADLATLIGNCQALNTIAGRIQNNCNVTFASPAAGGAKLHYGGDLNDLSLLAQHTAESTVMAAHFAAEFRFFVGVDAGDYSVMEKNAQAMWEHWASAAR